MNIQEKKAFFETHGYLKINLGLSEDYCQEIISDLEHHYIKLTANRLTDAWMLCRNVKLLAGNSKILLTLGELFDKEAIPFQTLNFCTGSEQKTHSDSIHFNSLPPLFMCGVWVALEDISMDSGPLHYYPGSQKLPLIDRSHIEQTFDLEVSHEKIYNQYEAYMAKQIIEKNLQKESLIVNRGEALIWSANILHGGEKVNKPGLTRHSQVNHYYFKDCHYFTPLFSDIPNKKLLDRSITDIRTGENYSAGFNQNQIESGLNQLREISADY